MEVDLFEPSSPDTRKGGEGAAWSRCDNDDKDLLETRSPPRESQNANKSSGQELPVQFIRIPSPDSIEKSTQNLSSSSPFDANPSASKETNTQEDARTEASASMPPSIKPNEVDERAFERAPEPFHGAIDSNAILPDIPAANVEPVLLNIVDYSESSDGSSTVKKTAPQIVVTEPRSYVISFIHKGRLVPKKTVVVQERQPIPFFKMGKFEFGVDVMSRAVEPHQCAPSQERVIPKKSAATQTETVKSKDNSVQTENKKLSTVETQTKSAAFSNASAQTDTRETTEVEVQTEHLFNSFLGEISGVEPMERKQSSRESSPDVFNEHSKRARQLSSSSDGTEESEPKRKRATFDVDTAEFQTPVAPPVAPPPPVVPAEEPACKTVIMESDQESDSVDILAPTPPRKPPAVRPPPKRVFTCSSLQV